MEASEIVMRRFLAGFEQRAWSRLPGGWDAPRPEAGKLRRSAAVLLEVAERPTVGEMQASLDEIAKRVGEREGQRDASPEEGKSAGRQRGTLGESSLWREIRDLLNRHLGSESGEGTSSLFSLEICRDERWVGALARSVQIAGAPLPPPTEEALAALARILLRAKAREWSDEDRRRHRSPAGEER